MRYLSLAVVALGILAGCSPIPLIQSPRIDSKLSLSAGMKNSGLNGVNYADSAIRSKEKFVVDDKVPFFMSLGIRDRVELSGALFPYLFYGFLWQGNAKVKIFDVGRRSFRNLASAAFLGGDGYGGEHDGRESYYGGISLGTFADVASSQAELVVQTSVARERQYSKERAERYEILWVQPAAGIVCRLGSRRRVSLNVGVNYSHPMKSDVLLADYSSPEIQTRYVNTAQGGFAFVGELRFNVVR